MSNVVSPDEQNAFCYTEAGFQLAPLYGSHHFVWNELQCAFGFKLDLLTTDEICLDLFFGNGESIRLCESLPGWPEFLQRLGAQFPTIPSGWEWDVMQPPFATNMTLLFERSGKTLPQAVEAWYSPLPPTRKWWSPIRAFFGKK